MPKPLECDLLMLYLTFGKYHSDYLFGEEGMFGFADLHKRAWIILRLDSDRFMN